MKVKQILNKAMVTILVFSLFLSSMSFVSQAEDNQDKITVQSVGTSLDSLKEYGEGVLKKLCENDSDIIMMDLDWASDDDSYSWAIIYKDTLTCCATALSNGFPMLFIGILTSSDDSETTETDYINLLTELILLIDESLTETEAEEVISKAATTSSGVFDGAFKKNDIYYKLYDDLTFSIVFYDENTETEEVATQNTLITGASQDGYWEEFLTKLCENNSNIIASNLDGIIDIESGSSWEIIYKDSITCFAVINNSDTSSSFSINVSQYSVDAETAAAEYRNLLLECIHLADESLTNAEVESILEMIEHNRDEPLGGNNIWYSLGEDLLFMMLIDTEDTETGENSVLKDQAEEELDGVLYEVVTTSSNLNVRSEPDSDSEIIGKLSNADSVIGTGEVSGNWVQIYYSPDGTDENVTGWVAESYLMEVTKDNPENSETEDRAIETEMMKEASQEEKGDNDSADTASMYSFGENIPLGKVYTAGGFWYDLTIRFEKILKPTEVMGINLWNGITGQLYIQFAVTLNASGQPLGIMANLEDCMSIFLEGNKNLSFVGDTDLPNISKERTYLVKLSDLFSYYSNNNKNGFLTVLCNEENSARNSLMVMLP